MSTAEIEQFLDSIVISINPGNDIFKTRKLNQFEREEEKKKLLEVQKINKDKYIENFYTEYKGKVIKLNEKSMLRISMNLLIMQLSSSNENDKLLWKTIDGSILELGLGDLKALLQLGLQNLSLTILD
jgi:hypothetical protein